MRGLFEMSDLRVHRDKRGTLHIEGGRAEIVRCHFSEAKKSPKSPAICLHDRDGRCPTADEGIHWSQMGKFVRWCRS